MMRSASRTVTIVISGAAAFRVRFMGAGGEATTYTADGRESDRWKTGSNIINSRKKHTETTAYGICGRENDRKEKSVQYH